MADSLIERCNNFFTCVYNDLSNAAKQGSKWVSSNFDSMIDGVTWIWGVLKGDWDGERSDSQIIADAVLGFVPYVGQVLDIRDLAACIYSLTNDKDRTPTHQKWVALTLAIFGTIPGAGDVAKAALKIILLKIRKMGANNVGRAVQAALMPIRRLLRDEQLVKLVGSQRLQNVYRTMANWCRTKAKSLAVQDIINRWKALNKILADEVIGKVEYALPNGAMSDLRHLLAESQRLQNQAVRPLQSAVDEVKVTLNGIADALEKEAGGLQAARVGNKTPVRLKRHDPNIVRGWNNAKKGLYGELISDEYMVNKGFKNLLPDNRRVRSLEDVPKGRGIDGIYGNPNPPPPYIVTETKFRTAVGEYVDSDGTLTRAKNVEGLLGNTKDGKQMSNRWIKNRLEKEIGDAQARKVEQSYESWLMIVGPDGKVETIYKLDQNAKVVGTVKI